MSLKTTHRDPRGRGGAAVEQAGMCHAPRPEPQQAPEPRGRERRAGAEVMLPKREGEPKSSLCQASCQPAKLIKTKGGSKRGTVTQKSVQGQSTLAKACTTPSAKSRLLLGTFLRIPALSVIAPQKTSWNRMEFLTDDSQSTGGSFLYLDVRKEGPSDRTRGGCG